MSTQYLRAKIFLLFLFILSPAFTARAQTLTPLTGQSQMVADDYYPVPRPKPADTEYLIGTFVCNFWYPYRELPYHTWVMDGVRCTYWPVLGRYYSGDPYAWDWQIKWAVEHGIGFFVVYWYWESGQSEPWKSFRENIFNGLLKARYLNYTKFALCLGVEPICNMGSPKEIKNELTAAVRDITTRLFEHPCYLRLNGRPVLFFEKTGLLLDKFGVEAVINIVQAVREEARRDGYEVHMINVGLGNPFDRSRALLQVRIASFFDGNAFSDIWAGAWYPPYLSFNEEGMPILIAPYRLLVDAWLSFANEWRNLLGHSYIPSVILGFNNSGWYACPSKAGFENWLCVRTEVTSHEMLRMCEGMRNFADMEENRMLLVWSWDEFGEGHSIQPAVEYGFSRLNVIRQVFTSDGKPCVDSMPVLLSSGTIETIYWDGQNMRLAITIRETRAMSSTVNILSEICPLYVEFQGKRVSGEDIYNGTHIVVRLVLLKECTEIVVEYIREPDIILDVEPRATSIVVDGTTYISSELPKSFRWIRGSRHTFSVESVVRVTENKRLVFIGWNDGIISNPRTITVDSRMKYVAIYRTEYYVVVSSGFGDAKGSGWYFAGDLVNISISPLVIERDFFTNYVFDGWRTDGTIVSTSPSYSFMISEPVSLTACWKTELNIIRVITIAGGIMMIVVGALVSLRRYHKS